MTLGWQKVADEYRLAPFGQGRTLPRDRLQAQAEEFNDQFRQREALTMSQTVENLGGPGSGRARYLRAIMTTPYAVHPLLPFAGPPMMHPMGYGAGAAYSAPNDQDLRAGEPDPEMTALETGITHTASVRFAEAMGRVLAEKRAQEEPAYMYGPEAYAPYEEAPSPQYVRALASPPVAPHAQAARQNAVRALTHVGQGLGESAMAAGHGLQAAAGAVGRGLQGFMGQEATSDQRWGTGFSPAPVTNEYGQPLRM